MTQPNLKKDGIFRRERPFHVRGRLWEIEMFFEGRGPEHKTLHRLVEKLEKANIPYAVVGGMAVNFHNHKRATNDVDILLTREGYRRFRKLFIPKSYDEVPNRPRRFLDRRQQRTIDILVTGHFPGSGEPGPIAYPDPAQVSETIENTRVVDLATLIQLKLAARRHQDFADVVSLIRIHNLDNSFLPRLHPCLHQDFIECLEEKRREDAYEARHDQRFEEMEREDDYEANED